MKSDTFTKSLQVSINHIKQNTPPLTAEMNVDKLQWSPLVTR